MSHSMIEPNGFDDFVARFRALQGDAESYGLRSVAVLLEDDLRASAERKNVMWTGGHMVAVGMLEYAKNILLRDGDERSS